MYKIGSSSVLKLSSQIVDNSEISNLIKNINDWVHECPDENRSDVANKLISDIQDAKNKRLDQIYLVNEINIGNNDRITSLPKGLSAWVIIIENLQELKNIPDDIKCNLFRVTNCEKIKTIPKLNEKCAVLINECAQFNNFPEGMVVRCTVLKKLNNLTHIPNDFKCTDGLDIEECDNIPYIPNVILGTDDNTTNRPHTKFRVANCKSVKEVSNDIVTSVCFYLQNLPALERLPSKLQGYRIILQQLPLVTGFIELGDGVTFQNETRIQIKHCPNFKNFPSKTSANITRLGIGFCEKFEKLSENLQINGKLIIHDCKRFKKLPDSVKYQSCDLKDNHGEDFIIPSSSEEKI